MNTTTRRFPRSMDEAFGPHTSHLITDKKTPFDWDGVVIVLGCIAAVVLAYAIPYWSAM
jgi:hypothetical protein